ncbi:MAG: iron ABC transporter substrate-binding protein [Chloroflexi bacterium]|nr:iron ABC transporter substrate-binding protein [Chloroflexota bacterium]MDA1218662.1 iron ABC transporter substrate-binding protein [Chloroflexota bacterium]
MGVVKQSRFWGWPVCLLAAFVLLNLVACARGGDELVVYSSRSSSLVQPLLEQYAEQTGTNIRVRYASTASVVATLLEEGDNSPADVIYLAEPSGWAVLSQAGTLTQLPDSLLEKVDPRFRSSKGEWVGTSGRSKVVVYNTENVIPERDLPQSIMDFTDPKWKDRIGWAPTHGEWQISLMSIRLLEGDDAARAWLEGIKDNNPKSYPNLISIVQAVANGDVDVGFVNHYYVPRLIAEQGEGLKARNYYLGNGDAGATIDVAGVAIHQSTGSGNAAEDFVAYMLDVAAQQYFAQETQEYPLSAGVSPSGDLPPLSELDPPHIDLADLSDLEGTIALLRDTGVIP